MFAAVATTSDTAGNLPAYPLHMATQPLLTPTRLRRYANQQALFSPTDRLLVAVSGGVDSVVLCDLLAHLGQPAEVAHVNYGLRGAASDHDEAFVRALAAQLNWPCHVRQHPNTAAVARAAGVSVQMAARTLRYRWFEELLAETECTHVATAHHADDAIETLLLNLTRGTGLAGLRGIAPRRGTVVRPLLFATRRQVERYAQTQALAWREDASNQQTHYRRNFLRHEVVPQLRQLNPRLEQAFERTYARVGAAQRLVAHYVAEARQKVWCPQAGGVTYVDLTALRTCPEPAFLLAELLRKVGFDERQAAAMLTEGQAGRSFYSATHHLVTDRARLVITRKLPPPAAPCRVTAAQKAATFGGGRLHLDTFPASGYVPPPDPRVASLDADQLHFPLVVRPWQAGDRFRPLGMGGSKKLSDFLSDRRVPHNLKAHVWVVTSAGNIVWVVGHRIDARARLTAGSVRVWQARWTDEEETSPYHDSP